MSALGDLREALRKRALELGAAACGCCGVEPLLRGRAALERWVERGAAGEMRYLTRDPAARADPRSLLPDARSALVVAVCYARAGSVDRALPAGEGRVARYARGADYHRVLHRLLTALAALLRDHDAAVQTRLCIDSAPLLERELAMRAGIGFIGRNTLLLTPGVGSYTVLGVLLCSLPLPPDAPAEARCGRCRRCLDACPTNAFDEPGYGLDARRCLSYLTIEYRGAIDDALDPDGSLRANLGERVFGCDACQDVCPYNRPTRRSQDVAVLPTLDADAHPAGLPLAQLLTQRAGDYRRLVRRRALARASRPQLARNAALLAHCEPQGGDHLDAALAHACDDARPEVAAAARWARARRARQRS